MVESKLVRAERNIAPAFELSLTANYALQKAGSTEEGSFLELLTAVTMSALSFEAALNQVGVRLWDKRPQVWSAIEKSSPLDKFAAIAEQAGFEFDPGSRPYQTVARLVRLRNDIVHGKPEHFSREIPYAAADDRSAWRQIEGLSAKWEQACTLEFATRALEDVTALVDAVSEKVGVPSPMHFGGLTTYNL